MKTLSIAPERGEIVREFSQKEIDDIVAGLINDSIDIETVPSYIHSRLLTPLSLARNEAKLGNQAEKYNHLNNIIWSLKLTLAQPDKSLMPQMDFTSNKKSEKPKSIDSRDHSSSSLSSRYHNTQKNEISLVTAFKKEDDYSNAITARRLKGSIDTTREYYEKEEKHLNDLKNKEYSDLCKTYKMQEVPLDANEAKRAQDEFELQLVDSRNKWNDKIKKLQEDKDKEISEMETELSYYDKPPNYEDILYMSYEDQLENTVQVQPKKTQRTQKSPQSTKKMSKTLQPKKAPK